MTDNNTTQVPFAPHATGWHSTKNKNVAYAVLDGRVAQTMDTQALDKCLCVSVAEFLGVPTKQVELIDAKWASDFFCGSVLIVYYAKSVE
jgi:mannose-6-phosphate isomerase-like protein (cupin superfamily)